MVKELGIQASGHELTKLQAIEEMKHAEEIVERIIFLDGTPSVDVGLKPRLRSKVQEQVEANLKDERDAVCQYKKPRRSASRDGGSGSHVRWHDPGRATCRILGGADERNPGVSIANYLARQWTPKSSYHERCAIQR